MAGETAKNSVSGWELIERNTTVRPNRIDHNFIWQSRDSIGQAHKRLGVKVLGDEPSIDRWFIKKPEEWEREERKTTPANVILPALSFFLIAAFVIMMLLKFGSNVIKGRAKLRLLGMVAVISFFAFSLKILNELPSFMASYFTFVPLKNWYIVEGITRTITVLFYSIAAAVGVGAVMGTEPGRKMREKIPVRENILLSIIAVFYTAGILSLLRWFEIAFNLPVRNPTIILPAFLSSYFPVLSLPAQIIKKLCITFPLVIIAYLWFRRKFTSDWKLFVAGAVAMVVLSFDSNRLFSEFVWSAVKYLVIFAGGWAIVKYLLKDDIPIYISAILLAVPLYYAAQWLMCAGNSFFTLNAVVSAAFGVLLWLAAVLHFKST
ncbi:hypothetical protein DRQ26_06810 [bacterium]|nr:MAG: hypothetical protein DRQ26_06810 [bacterium]